MKFRPQSFILQRLNQVLVAFNYVAFVCSDIVSKFLRISLFLDFTELILFYKLAIESVGGNGIAIIMFDYSSVRKLKVWLYRRLFSILVPINHEPKEKDFFVRIPCDRVLRLFTRLIHNYQLFEKGKTFLSPPGMVHSQHGGGRDKKGSLQKVDFLF